MLVYEFIKTGDILYMYSPVPSVNPGYIGKLGGPGYAKQ